MDIRFDLKPGTAVQTGEIVGSIEGFKAISDIYCVGSGRFVGGNPALESELENVSEKPYDDGWLYQFEGEPDLRAMDVNGYRSLLDTTIDRILEKQQSEGSAND